MQKLNTQHRAAARLKAEGATIERIHKELGVAVRTLHVWFSDDLVKDEVRRLYGRIEDVFVERKATAGLRALEELSSFAAMPASKQVAVCAVCGWFGQTPANHGDPQAPCAGPWEITERINESTKLDALREILDRVDETTTLRDRAKATEALNSGGDGGEGNTYVNIFRGLKDEDLADLLRSWATSGDTIGTTAQDA